MKNFSISTNVYFGENSLGILDTIQDKHVLIVCDSFMESSGIVDKVKEHLSACQVDVFSKVVPDPPIEIVSEGIQCLQSCKADVMIAVGGGSSIDAAKAIRGLSRPDAPTVPIIALSANAFAEDIQKSKNAGINEHLAKPLEMDKVLKVIASYCK